MRKLLITTLFLVVIIPTAQAQTLSLRLSAAMKAAAPGEKIPVIIHLSARAKLPAMASKGRSVRQLSNEERRVYRSGLIKGLRSQADRSQGKLRKFLRDQGIAEQKSLWINNSIAVEASPEIIQRLAGRPEVASISLDAVVRLPEIAPAATSGVEDNLVTIHVPDLWALGFKGEGMVIALIDSGVDYLHPDLNPAWRGGSNSWYNPVADDCALNPAFCTSCDFSASAPCDFLDTSSDPSGIAHGTGVAGILVGGDAGGTAIGVAPNAQWIAAKIFKSDGTALSSDIHQAFQWVLDPDGNPDTDDAPDVVNSSWVLEEPHVCERIFEPDVQALEAAGIAAVFAAGNDGPSLSTDDSPANYVESLAVGSVGTHTSSLTISDFSSRGPSRCDQEDSVSGAVYPEVVAPGFLVKTTDYSDGGSANYVQLAGTSFSAPEVAGILALLGQAFPLAPLADLEDAVIQSAQDLGASGADNTYGHGLVDAAAAYDWMLQAPNLAVTDPVAPANDRQVDFGSILPSAVNQKTIVLSNSGRGELKFGNISLSGDTAFSLAADGCSLQTLIGGQSCNLVVSFSSASIGGYSGSITVPSNDLDDPAATIALSGVVTDAAHATPRLIISDSVAPTGDQNIPFGVVVVGATRAESLQISNQGLGVLTLGSLDRSTLDKAFSITSDGCSNHSLSYGVTCQIGISFTPVAGGTINGLLTLTSNDSTSPSQVTVSGTGNHLPPTPTLLTPSSGATNIALPVELTWRQRPDADGEAITNKLYVSTDSGFISVTPIEIARNAGGQTVLPAGFGGLLLVAGLLPIRRKPRLLRVLILAASLVFLVSCGGGGGGSSGPDPNLRSYSLTGLSSQTTYYWKVSAVDTKGGTVESSVASFTTE